MTYAVRATLGRSLLGYTSQSHEILTKYKTMMEDNYHFKSIPRSRGYKNMHAYLS